MHYIFTAGAKAMVFFRYLIPYGIISTEQLYTGLNEMIELLPTIEILHVAGRTANSSYVEYFNTRFSFDLFIKIHSSMKIFI